MRRLSKALQEWYVGLNSWQQAGVWAVGTAILFGVVFGVISGQWSMVLGGLIIGALSGPAAYRYAKD